MLRTTLMAAVALLAAGAVGLVTVEAQSGRVPPKLNDVKKFQAMQKEFNGVMDGLVGFGRRLPGPGGFNTVNKVGSTIVNERVWRDAVDKTIYKSKDGKNVLTINDLQKLQRDMRGRLDSVTKTGKLTELDRGLLKGIDARGLMKTLGTGRTGPIGPGGPGKAIVDRRLP